MDLILASQSATRRRILNSARVSARFMSPQIDEENITKSLSAEQATPRENISKESRQLGDWL